MENRANREKRLVLRSRIMLNAAPREKFDVASEAPAPTLINTEPTFFFKHTKVILRVWAIFLSDFL
jgi:hypothetical protein